MNQWTFVTAAYGLAAIATLGLIAWAYLSMRKAEADAEAVKRRPLSSVPSISDSCSSSWPCSHL